MIQIVCAWIMGVCFGIGVGCAMSDSGVPKGGSEMIHDITCLLIGMGIALAICVFVRLIVETGVLPWK